MGLKQWAEDTIGKVNNWIGGIWDDYTGKSTADDSLEFQKEQFEYQKDLNEETMEREDNAHQREVADLYNAGLSPLANMSGSASGGTSGSSMAGVSWNGSANAVNSLTNTVTSGLGAFNDTRIASETVKNINADTKLKGAQADETDMHYNQMFNDIQVKKDELGNQIRALDQKDEDLKIQKEALEDKKKNTEINENEYESRKKALEDQMKTNEEERKKMQEEQANLKVEREKLAAERDNIRDRDFWQNRLDSANEKLMGAQQNLLSIQEQQATLDYQIAQLEDEIKQEMDFYTKQYKEALLQSKRTSAKILADNVKTWTDTVQVLSEESRAWIRAAKSGFMLK